MCVPSLWATTSHIKDVQGEIIRIDITGNHVLSRKTLVYTAPFEVPHPFYFWRSGERYDPNLISQYIHDIQQLYRQAGYYSTQVQVRAVEDTAGVIIDVSIKEGCPVYVQKISIRGVDDMVGGGALPLREGAVFTYKKYMDTQVELLGRVGNAGYPWAQVTRTAEVDVTKSTVRVVYTVDPGEKAVWEKITLKNLTRYKYSTMQKWIPPLIGTPYSDRSVRLLQRELQKSGLVRSSSIDKHLLSTGGLEGVVSVSEKPPRGVYVSVGYDTEEGARARARWRHLNVFGDGEHFSISGTESQTGFYYGVSLEKKRITNHWDAQIWAKSKRREEEIFDLYEDKIMLACTYHPITSIDIVMAYQLNIYDQRKMDTAVYGFLSSKNGGVIQQGRQRGPSLRIEYTPFSTDEDRWWSYRFQGNISALGESHAIDYYRLDCNQSAYYVPWDEGSIHLTINTSFLDPHTSEVSIPSYQRLYAGGDLGVRGYERWHLGPLVGGKPVGGLSRLESSLELRHHLKGPWDILAFLDAGHLNLNEYTLGSLDYATGMGMVYTSPLANLSLSIGAPLDPPPADRPWNIHFKVDKDF